MVKGFVEFIKKNSYSLLYFFVEIDKINFLRFNKKLTRRRYD